MNSLFQNQTISTYVILDSVSKISSYVSSYEISSESKVHMYNSFSKMIIIRENYVLRTRRHLLLHLKGTGLVNNAVVLAKLSPSEIRKESNIFRTHL